MLAASSTPSPRISSARPSTPPPVLIAPSFSPGIPPNIFSVPTSVKPLPAPYASALFRLAPSCSASRAPLAAESPKTIAILAPSTGALLSREETLLAPPVAAFNAIPGIMRAPEPASSCAFFAEPTGCAQSFTFCIAESAKLVFAVFFATSSQNLPASFAPASLSAPLSAFSAAEVT